MLVTFVLDFAIIIVLLQAYAAFLFPPQKKKLATWH